MGFTSCLGLILVKGATLIIELEGQYFRAYADAAGSSRNTSVLPIANLSKLIPDLKRHTVEVSSKTKKNRNKNYPAQIIHNLDDVTIPHYGSDPCAHFKPKMSDFRAPGRRISEVKCFEHFWNMKLKQQEASRDEICRMVDEKEVRPGAVGGFNADAGQFPHMAAIGWKATERKWIFKCGASLISNKFLLTAAHCSETSAGDTTVIDTVPKIVRLGGHSITEYDLDGIPTTDVDIKRFIIHPRYRAPRKYYDIALIKLRRTVRFQWMIHPACLGTSLQLENNVPATVTGWGVMDLATFQTSPVLQVVVINLMASDECDKKLRFGWNRNFRGMANHQLCAGHMAGGIDACTGDSGGPLQVKLNITPVVQWPRWHMHRILGVTSFGFGYARANTPGVYTRVASFLDWIEENVWPKDFKKK